MKDRLHKLTMVSHYGALASMERMGLGPSQTYANAQIPGLGSVINAARIIGDVQTGYAQRTAGTRDLHEDEIAVPGYYSVLLRDYEIRAELSATERAGIHRYTFPKSDSSHFILDLVHSFSNTPVIWVYLKIVGNDTIVGGRSLKGWAPEREIYFSMQFSKPFASAQIISGDKPLDATVREAKGTALKCLLHFKTTDREVISVKTGISAVSDEGAHKNVAAEIPDWDFEKVRRAAHAAWNANLSKIRVDTATPRHKTIFYTALYHMLVAPTLFDDVDGQYRGMDGKIHQLPKGVHNYSTFSLWDTYRAAHPMYTICQPDRVPDFVNCLIRMAQESPAGVPIWPLQGRETFCMREVHRFIADSIFSSDKFERIANEIESRKREATGRKIAVVGAGPAGLTAAFYLAMLGHDVTVYDSKSEAGGMLRFALPEYRLPKSILRREIELIERLGVKFTFNTRVGVDVALNDLDDRFDMAAAGYRLPKSAVPSLTIVPLDWGFCVCPSSGFSSLSLPPEGCSVQTP